MPHYVSLDFRCKDTKTSFNFFKKNITLYKNKYYFCTLRLYIVKQEDDEKIIDLNY